MQTFYAEKFGPGVVEIVKDSNSVERDRLDANKVTCMFEIVSDARDFYFCEFLIF